MADLSIFVPKKPESKLPKVIDPRPIPIETEQDIGLSGMDAVSEGFTQMYPALFHFETRNFPNLYRDAVIAYFYE